MIKAEELAKKMRKQRCHHCKDGRSFDGQFIFCLGIKGLFSLHFCPWDAERRLLKTGKKFWWGD